MQNAGRFGVYAVVCCGILATVAAISMSAAIVWWITECQTGPANMGSWSIASGAGAIGVAGLMANIARRCFVIFGEIARQAPLKHLESEINRKPVAKGDCRE